MGLPYLLLCLVSLSGCYSYRYPSLELVDLTHPFNENARYHPVYGDRGKFTYNLWNLTGFGLVFQAGDYKGLEHSGTHIDAPFHLDPKGLKVHEVPLDRLIAPASVIHLGEKTRNNRDYEMTVQDLLDWERTNGCSLDNTILIVDLGWNRHYLDKDKYFTGRPGGLGPDGKGQLHHPGVSKEAAYWLLDHRNVYGIMSDTPNPDPGIATQLHVHEAFLFNGRWIVENLGGDLASLPEIVPELMVLPMKIDGGTGGPTRIVAKVWKWRSYF